MKKRAFTLIELLVVISIIALLLSILMPALSRVKEIARMTVCKSNMKQLLTARNVYTVDNYETYPQSIGGYNPLPAYWPGDQSALDGMDDDEKTAYVAKNATWFGLIGTYISWEKGEYTLDRKNSEGTVGRCPSHRGGMKGNTSDGKINFSYHGNRLMFKDWWDYDDYYDKPGKLPPVKSTAVKYASSKVLIFELFMDCDWPLALFWDVRGAFNEETQWFRYGDETGWAPTHGNNLNYGFADGHVESIDHMKRLGEDFFKLDTSPSSWE